MKAAAFHRIQVPQAVLEALAAHHVPRADSDDAMIICLDWHGRPTAGEHTPTM